MRPISLSSVCRVVYERNFDEIQRYKGYKADAMPYTKDKFTKDVLADGFILSMTTVAMKWKSFEATGLVKKGSYRTALNIRMLEEMAEASE